ncbi:MAG: hypothetical protein AAF598_19845 [Bacteroidota bacterium]
MMWTFWSLTITYWRLWAFRVIPKEHWAELKSYAIQVKLIWGDFGGFEFTEFRTKRQAEQIEAIQDQLFKLEAEAFELKQADLPDRLAYPLKPIEKWAILIVWPLILAFVITSIFVIPKIWFVILIIAIVVLKDTNKFLNMIRLVPQKTLFMIDDTGIHIDYPIKEFVAWNEINFLEVNASERELYCVTSREMETTITFKLNPFKIGSMHLLEQNLEAFLTKYMNGRLSEEE